MDSGFADEIRASYQLADPALVLGSALHDGQPLNEPRVQVALSMLNRHGLIAGATGHGQDQDPAVIAGQLSRGRRSRSSSPTSRATSPGSPRPATRRPEGQRARRGDGLDVQRRRPPGRVSVAVGQARRPGARDGALVRAAAARQGDRPQRHADVDPVARLQVLRRQPAAAARPRGPADDAEFLASDDGKPTLARLRRDVAARRWA